MIFTINLKYQNILYNFVKGGEKVKKIIILLILGFLVLNGLGSALDTDSTVERHCIDLQDFETVSIH